MKQKIRQNFVRTLLSSCILATLTTHTLAAEESVETIEVTGIRASQSKAIMTKRTSANIVDAISAEDIGQLPDVSIADSIRRIVGVNFQTSEGGEADTASIRGLGANLTLTTLNGRVLTTTEQGSRKVALGRLPSELIQRVAVSKSPQAKMIEGGVAGTVQMETIRPLDRNKRTVTAIFRAQANENAAEFDNQEELGWRGSVSYIDQLMDGSLGVAFGWAGLRQDSPAYRVRGANVQARSNSSGARGYRENDTSINHLRNDFDNNGVLEVLPMALSYDALQQELDRNTVMAVIEFAPTDALKLVFDAAYVVQDTFTTNNRLSVQNQGIYNLGPVSADHAIVDSETNILMASTLGSAQVANLTNPNLNADETLNLGLSAEWLMDDWKFVGDLSYSHSGRDRDNPTLIAVMRTNDEITQQQFDGVTGNVNFRRWASFDMRDKGNLILGLDQGVEDPNQWAVESILDYNENSEDIISSARFDAEWYVDTGILTSIDMGVRLEHHNAKQASNKDKYFYGRNDQAGDSLAPGQRRRLDESYASASPFPFMGLFNAFGDKSKDGQVVQAFDGSEVMLDYTPAWPIWDVNRVLAQAKDDLKTPYVDADFYDDQQFGTDLLRNFDLTEETFAAYLQANFEFDLFGHSTTGNAGLRYVKTDVSSTAVIPDINQVYALDTDEEGKYALGLRASDMQASTKKHSYTELLPSFNLNIALNSEWNLRLAAARTLSRAPFIDLRNSVDLNADANSAETLLVTAGQPALNPFAANQVDVSLEWYPNADTSVTLAYYYKNVESYLTKELIIGSRDVFTSKLPIPIDDEGNEVMRAIKVETTLPINAEQNFDFQGVEFSYRQAFNFLPGFWSGFGVEANWSYNDTNAVDDAVAPLITGERETVIVRAVDVSRYIENYILYYEGDKGSIRFAWQRQSPYNRSDVGLNNSYEQTQDGQLDMTINYKINKHFRVIGSITNLTESNIEQYHLDERNPDNLVMPFSILQGGRNYTLGLRATF